MTDYADRMKRIVTAIHPLLKDVGFRKRRHTFNRETEPGLIHVINFQMGQYPIGERSEIWPFNVDMYGKFTVNLGVFVAELHEALLGTELPTFPVEYHCEIRTRLGELLDLERTPGLEEVPGVDGGGWWSLERTPTTTAVDLQQALFEHGLPYLDHFRTRQDIIEAWASPKGSHGFPIRADLMVAVIELRRGEHERAIRILRGYLRKPMRNPKHADYVRGIAARLGLDLNL